MRIDIILLPEQAFDPARCVCVVVDVLRASSSIVTLLSRGAACVVAARDVEHARALSARFPEHLLCGETAGLPPEGFGYGNSPAEFSRLQLAGRSAILATSNGTRILATLAARAPVVLAGSLLNRTAAARTALHLAQERGLDVAIVCSAAYGGSTFVLEDALGAGAIAGAALELKPELEAADAARFARDAFLTARPRLAEAIASAYHARELIDAGLGKDVAYCAQMDVWDVAPVLERGEDGLLRLAAYGAISS
jgi:2-phosphosulfolactate phosphatase